MKKYLMIITIFLFAFTAFSQEYIFKFKIDSKKELNTLSKIISIDNYKNGEVTAYANPKEFETFKTLGYKFELLPHPGNGKSLTMATTVGEMANWNRYPTYDVYVQMMNDFASNHPSLCQLVTIGTSEEGRELLAVKISDNVSSHEQEPEFFYTGTMHGDETTGFVLLLRLIDYLLTNYGTESRITNLINNTEIYINPASNPDGTYNGGNNTISSATRSNSNGIDLNRNFPTPNDVTPSGMNESEIQAMISFAEDHHFVFSANTHGGIEVLNFPWDSWTSNIKTHADHDWLYHVCRNYADSVHMYSPASYLDSYDNGVTHGGDWYVVDGSRQDYMTYFRNCREITMELSNLKLLNVEDLPDHWNYNRSAFLGFIEEMVYGFNGTVKNLNGDPLDAKIEITAYDADNSWVVTDPANGDYYRPIAPGTYDVTYSSYGYISQTHSVSVTGWETTTIKDVVLLEAAVVNISGTVIENGTSNPLQDVKIEILDSPISPVFTAADGTYSISDVMEDIYQIKASLAGYTSIIQTVDISSTTVVDFTLSISNAISFESDVPDIFTFGGNLPWTQVTNEAFDGTNSMKSGSISDDQISVMETELNITSVGDISFYKMVSSEGGYDYLRFYIDDVEQGSGWSGEVDWSQESFFVSTTGIHTFKWEYSKDGSVSNGSDCAWVDYIEFPEFEEPPTYTVTFNVTDGSIPIENANVNFNSQNISTNAGGQAVFIEIDPGTNLAWSVSKTGYDTENGTVTITNDNVTQNVVLTEAVTYTVTFNVNDGTNAIEGASIDFNMENKDTDISGQAVFYDVSTGNNQAYSITKSGFNTFNGQLNVIDQDIDMNIPLTTAVSVDVLLSLSSIKISPNPFSEFTSFEFSLKEEAPVFLGIYAYNGQLIKTLINENLNTGVHKIIWNGKDAANQSVSNGIYFCKLIYSGHSKSQKIVLIR